MVLSIESQLVEVKDLPGVGGGRGVFSLTGIQPGQLIIREHPLITVPNDKQDEETLHMALARAVILYPEPLTLEEGMRHLHPVTLDVLESKVLETVSKEYEKDVDVLLSLATTQLPTPATSSVSVQQPAQSTDAVKPTEEQLSSVTVAGLNQGAAHQESIVHSGEDGDGQGAGTRWTRKSLLRLLLVLRFNAHPSGLYSVSEMVNHRCCPNAIKLAVGGWSELRALRPIPAGTEVTITYIDPPLQTYKRRCELLEIQHFFRPSSSEGYPWEMEAWSQQVASELKERQLEVEARLDQLEEELDRLERESVISCEMLRVEVRREAAMKAKALRQKNTQGSNILTKDPSRTITCIPTTSLSSHACPLAQVATLLSTSCRVRRDCVILLHPGHMVLARTHELIITLASALLGAEHTHAPPTPRKPPAHPPADQSGSAGAGGPSTSATAPAAAAAAAATSTEGGVNVQSSSWLPEGLDLTWDVNASGGDQQQQQQQQEPNSGSVSGVPSPAAIAETPAARPAGGGRVSLRYDSVDIGVLLLRACLELEETQKLYAGPEHYDTIKTLVDMQNALEYLMGSAPKRLYQEFPSRFGTFSAASRAAYQIKQKVAALRREWS